MDAEKKQEILRRFKKWIEHGYVLDTSDEDIKDIIYELDITEADASELSRNESVAELIQGNLQRAIEASDEDSFLFPDKYYDEDGEIREEYKDRKPYEGY